MKKTRSIHEILKYLKDLLLPKFKPNKVRDADVADELKISANKLAACKKRGKIPYEDLIYYCQKKSLSTDEILFKQNR